MAYKPTGRPPGRPRKTVAVAPLEPPALPAPTLAPAPPSWAELHKLIRGMVSREFPRAKSVTTNEGHNPATPVTVIVKWAGGLHHAVRAGGYIRSKEDAVAFAKRAIADLSTWHQRRDAGTVAMPDDEPISPAQRDEGWPKWG